MKKTLKAILCIALCIVMLSSFAACGGNKKTKYVDTWVWIDGNELCTLELRKDNTVNYKVLYYGEEYDSEIGTWKVATDNTIIVTIEYSNKISESVFRYINGCLVDQLGNKYVRISNVNISERMESERKEMWGTVRPDESIYNEPGCSECISE